MKNRFLFIISFAVILFLSPVAANASSATDPEGMAVYLNKGFEGHSALVDGSIYSAGGDIIFNNAGDNNVTGYVYHKTGMQFQVQTAQNQTPPDFASRGIILDETSFDAEFPELADFPKIDNHVGSLITNWGDAPVTINENTHFGTVDIKSPVIVDVSGKDIILVIDNLTFQWNQKITLQGSGKLFLFIDHFNNVGPMSIDNDSNPNRTYIFSKSAISNQSMDLCAHVFYEGVSSLDHKGRITGSLVTDAASVTISGGQNEVYGLLYAPNAAVAAGSPGPNVPNVKGRLVADSLLLSGSGKIIYDPTYASLHVPPQFEDHSEHEGEYVNGLLGEYYDSSRPDNESALKMKRIDSAVAFNFMYGSPDPVIEPETYSIRWTGYIKPAVTGDYTFKTYSDDGVRLSINGEQLIDNWGYLSLAYTVSDHTIRLEAGQYHPITVEYQQMPLYAAVFLFWQADGVPMSLVPESAFYVAQSTYDAYNEAKYYNPIEKTGTGLINKFYTMNGDEKGSLKYTEENNVDYAWGAGAPENIEDDRFYGEMEGYLQAKFSEDTTLVFIVDDAIRVWIHDIGGAPVISDWNWNSLEEFTYTFRTEAGQKYRIRIEYADFGLGATCTMGWRGSALGSQVIPIEFLYSE